MLDINGLQADTHLTRYGSGKCLEKEPVSPSRQTQRRTGCRCMRFSGEKKNGGAPRGVEAFINARGFRESSHTKRLHNAAAGFDVGEVGVIAKTRTWTSWTILTTSWSHSETDNHQQ